MQTIELLEIIGSLTENKPTSTSPLICKTEDGKYVVKFFENVEGSRALINEFIVSKICELIGIKIPNPALIEIKNAIHKVKLGDQIVTINKGYAFGSKYIDKGFAYFNHRQLKTIKNPETLFDMIILDHLIDNRDREFNHSNVLFCLADGFLYLIDHERVFGAGNIWNSFTLKTSDKIDITKNFTHIDSIYTHIRPYYDFDYLIDKAVTKFKVVTRKDFSDIIYSVPDEWNLSIVDKNQLIEYLYERFSQVDYLVHLLKIRSKGGIEK